MKIIVFGLFFFAGCLNILNSQILESLRIDFEKTFREKDEENIVKGSIYYEDAEELVISVKEPVKQWIIAGDDKLTLYYPEDKLAFRFTTQTPISFPFFQAFWGVVKEDYGLTEIGYILSNHEIKGDTLVTTWCPPKGAKGIGHFVLVYVANKIVYAEHKDNGSIVSKTYYENHFKHGAYYFPLEITTIRYTDSDSTHEKITYTNPEFNCLISDSVRNLNIPTEVKIEEFIW